MRRGRPTSLTPELIAEFGAIFPSCLYISTAADFLGLHRVTLHRWLLRGRHEADRLANDPRAKPLASEALCLDFCNTYKKGLAQIEMVAISAIRAAAAGGPARVVKTTKTDRRGNVTEVERTEYFQGQWQAAAWLLERRFLEKWSRNRQAIRELQRAIRELQQRMSGRTRSAQE